MSDTYKIQKAHTARELHYAIRNDLSRGAEHRRIEDMLRETAPRHGNHRKMVAKERLHQRRSLRMASKVESRHIILDELGDSYNGV